MRRTRRRAVYIPRGTVVSSRRAANVIAVAAAAAAAASSVAASSVAAGGIGAIILFLSPEAATHYRARSPGPIYAYYVVLL